MLPRTPWAVLHREEGMRAAALTALEVGQGLFLGRGKRQVRFAGPALLARNEGHQVQGGPVVHGERQDVSVRAHLSGAPAGQETGQEPGGKIEDRAWGILTHMHALSALSSPRASMARSMGTRPR